MITRGHLARVRGARNKRLSDVNRGSHLLLFFSPRLTRRYDRDRPAVPIDVFAPVQRCVRGLFTVWRHHGSGFKLIESAAMRSRFPSGGMLGSVLFVGCAILMKHAKRILIRYTSSCQFI